MDKSKDLGGSFDELRSRRVKARPKRPVSISHTVGGSGTEAAGGAAELSDATQEGKLIL